MRKNWFPELFLAIGFVSVLTAILLVTCLAKKEDTSYYENRMLASFPEASTQSVLDGSYFAGIDDWLGDHCCGRITLLKIRTAFDLFVNVKLLRCPVVNEVVVRDDLLLPYNQYVPLDPSSVEIIREQAEELGENIGDVRDAVESYGGEYFFVCVPCQCISYREEYPSYLESLSGFVDTAKPALMKRLADRRVNVVDMGPVLLSPEIRDRAASRVDNHFTMYGAYLTYRAIMQAINETRDVPLVIMEEDDFTLTELPNYYVGSRTRKLFDQTNVKEHLSVLIPNEPVAFRRYDYSGEVAPTVYTLPERADELVEYQLYMGGDIGEMRIDTERDELPSILIYGDSFTNIVECVMYYGFNEMRSLDMRLYSTATTLGEYIRTHQPDYVVCIRDYEQLANPRDNGSGPALHVKNATVSPQNLRVDGVLQDAQKYNIDGANYFKLRDLAFLLRGTGSQFDVGWDERSRTVSLVTGNAYTPNGGELATTADRSVSAVPSTQIILIDGEKRTDLSVYNIGGENYFKLRDLGEALGFDVDYDEASNTAIVRSKKDGPPEEATLTVAG